MLNLQPGDIIRIVKGNHQSKKTNAVFIRKEKQYVVFRFIDETNELRCMPSSVLKVNDSDETTTDGDAHTNTPKPGDIIRIVKGKHKTPDKNAIFVCRDGQYVIFRFLGDSKHLACLPTSVVKSDCFDDTNNGADVVNAFNAMIASAMIEKKKLEEKLKKINDDITHFVESKKKWEASLTPAPARNDDDFEVGDAVVITLHSKGSYLQGYHGHHPCKNQPGIVTKVTNMFVHVDVINPKTGETETIKKKDYVQHLGQK